MSSPSYFRALVLGLPVSKSHVAHLSNLHLHIFVCPCLCISGSFSPTAYQGPHPHAHTSLLTLLQFNPELVLVSAGFDAAQGDPLGGCNVSPEGYAHLTHLLMGLASGRIILILEVTFSDPLPMPAGW